MGQAKYRKLTDPEYGKPSKMRGLIISCPMEIDEVTGSCSVADSNLDKQDLRASLLYWDRLAWPSGFIHMGGDADTDFLEHAGILTRPKYKYKGVGAHIVLEPQLMALEEFEKRDPGVWSLGQSKNSILLANGVVEEEQGMLLSLLGCLPVPSETVALSDILDFKHRRRDELLGFRSHFEEMVKEIQSSNDSEAALREKLVNLDSTCADLLSVTREWQVPIKISDLKASFNFDLTKAATDAVKIWVKTETLNLDLSERVVAASIAAISSQFKLSSGVKLRSMKRAHSPFAYVHSAHETLK